MPKSRTRKKAEMKKRKRQLSERQSRKKINSLVGMIQHLEKYEEQVLQPLVEDEDGMVLMTPEQARLIEEVQKMEENHGG